MPSMALIRAKAFLFIMLLRASARSRVPAGPPAWLCDGMLLGTTVAAVSLTSALGFSSAVVKSTPHSPSAITTTTTTTNNDNNFFRSFFFFFFTPIAPSPQIRHSCHECRALRMHQFGSGSASASASSSSSSSYGTLLRFSSSTDSVVAETLMSFLISFVIVTFSVFLVREMR